MYNYSVIDVYSRILYNETTNNECYGRINCWLGNLIRPNILISYVRLPWDLVLRNLRRKVYITSSKLKKIKSQIWVKALYLILPCWDIYSVIKIILLPISFQSFIYAINTPKFYT